MRSGFPNSSTILAARRRPLRLIATDGRRLPPHREGLDVAAIDAPETPLTVEFEGLSEAEQRAALAAFPGGKRFSLASRN